MTISPNSVVLAYGEPQQLTVKILPENAADKSVSWTSSDPKTVTVSKDGVIDGLMNGKATVTCTALDGSGVQATCDVRVINAVEPVRSIVLNPSVLNLEIGQSSQLTATIVPSSADNKSVKWSSTDVNVATVSANGLVTGVSEGSVTITCAALDGSGVTAACECDVKMRSKTVTVKGVPFVMLPVSKGSFMMGASNITDASPVHQVTISHNYYLGETEVTQEQWQAVMGTNPAKFNGVGNNYPVYEVSWNDCQTFIGKLNQLTGMHFRLPTEAEWEYAARGGQKSKGYAYSGSDNVDEVAWYWSSTSPGTIPVKSKKPNELGFYFMSGNVREWCGDWYDKNYYSQSPSVNPTGPASGMYRVLRGGSWDYGVTQCKVAYRGYYYPTDRQEDVGLRLYCE